MSIAYRKGVKQDGRAKLFLYGYGSYGAGMQANFNANRISLLDRGMVYVIAHIRGGNEMGEAWHDDGMLMKKKNTFYDFIDSAKWLIASKWTSPDRLVIEGGSAGGLLMGAVTNFEPGLFKAVHSAVPFVDVMNTMMDSSLPLTVGEYLEWGNPNDKAAAEYMRSYSPYDNLESKAYPAILVTTSLNDSQVMYWEPAKYVAKLRSLKTDNHPLLLKCNMGAGHGGASGRYDRLQGDGVRIRLADEPGGDPEITTGMIGMSLLKRVFLKILFFPLTRIFLAVFAIALVFGLELAAQQKIGEAYGLKGQAWYIVLSSTITIVSVCLVYAGYVRLFERRPTVELSKNERTSRVCDRRRDRLRSLHRDDCLSLGGRATTGSAGLGECRRQPR